MNAQEKRQQGAQKRYTYQQTRMARGKEHGALQEPKLEPAEVTGRLESYDGLIPIEYLENDLGVKLPFWGPTPDGRTDKVTLWLYDENDSEVHKQVQDFAGPLPGPGPQDFNIPKARVPHEGIFTIVYLVDAYDSNSTYSLPVQIIIDRTPPYYNVDPVLSSPSALVLPVTVITDDYFTSPITDFICTIPDYPDYAPGDAIAVYWGVDIPETPSSATPVFGPIEVPADRLVPIPRDVIETRPNGETFAVYWLADKAGNLSNVSTPAIVDVQLGPLPSGLQDPHVPLAPVYLADAHAGVVVEIPQFDNPVDVSVEVTWGATRLASYSPGTSPKFPLEIPVPWSVLKGEYTGGPGEEDVRVSYQVRKGTLLFPEAGPLFTDIEVDFSVIGPVNPDEPDPVNPNLPTVHLVGADNIPDTLTPADFGKDITATVELYNPVNEGERLELYWGAQTSAVAFRDVGVGEGPGLSVTFKIPHEAIEEEGNNPALPMYYIISKPGDNNYQRSKDTPVNVDVLTINLDAPTFPDIDQSLDILNCRSIYFEDPADLNKPYGFRVQVPGHKELKGGEEVVMEWLGYDLSGASIPATAFRDTHTLTSDEAQNGFIYLVPYDANILPILRGSGEAWYSIEIAGSPITSAKVMKDVSVVRPGNFTCEIPPPPLQRS